MTYLRNKIYTKPEIQITLENVVFKYPFIKNVWLFGSYARNEQTCRSDLDFVLELENEHDIYQLKKELEVSQELEDQFRIPVDTLTLHEAMKIMPRTFERDKVLIYESKDQNKI